jgi:hypothetical protein
MTDVEKEVERRTRIAERDLAMTRARGSTITAADHLDRAARMLAADPDDTLAPEYRKMADAVRKLGRATA